MEKDNGSVGATSEKVDRPRQTLIRLCNRFLLFSGSAMTLDIESINSHKKANRKRKDKTDENEDREERKKRRKKEKEREKESAIDGALSFHCSCFVTG